MISFHFYSSYILPVMIFAKTLHYQCRKNSPSRPRLLARAIMSIVSNIDRSLNECAAIWASYWDIWLQTWTLVIWFFMVCFAELAAGTEIDLVHFVVVYLELSLCCGMGQCRFAGFVKGEV
jgi:hypothetical protein